MNTGKEFEMDLFDLANRVRLKNPIEEIAMFLYRSQREVREKIAALERPGKLAKRIVNRYRADSRQLVKNLIYRS